MAKTRFTGPVYSYKGFRFLTTNYGDRPMTIICTSIVKAADATNAYAATLTNASLGGLDKAVTGWANWRRAATEAGLFLNVRPLGAANSVVCNMYSNIGTGSLFGGKAGTIDIYVLGYLS